MSFSALNYLYEVWSLHLSLLVRCRIDGNKDEARDTFYLVTYSAIQVTVYLRSIQNRSVVRIRTAARHLVTPALVYLNLCGMKVF